MLKPLRRQFFHRVYDVRSTLSVWVSRHSEVTSGQGGHVSLWVVALTFAPKELWDQLDRVGHRLLGPVLDMLTQQRVHFRNVKDSQTTYINIAFLYFKFKYGNQLRV